MNADPCPIVFLHIPKTAGQTIHNALTGLVGPDRVSPVRVHSQVGEGASQMPSGYSLYSGHLDWTDLESLPERRFVFTVLRDPRERIASFYFYLLKEAAALNQQALERPENKGKRAILTRSAEDYFFAGTPAWRHFVRDHYDNFYCSYLATRKVRGWLEIQSLRRAEKLVAALDNAARINRIYTTRNLGALETDIANRYGTKISVVNTYTNRGGISRDKLRWPMLLERLESDRAVRELERFATIDLALIDRLGLLV